MPGELATKTAIITGAGSGVGRASALRFADEGARVLCADVDVARVEETAQLVTARGGTAVAVCTDVSNEADVAAMIDTAVERFGRLDILFNNAGVPAPKLGMSLADHTEADFQRLVAINIGGVFFGTKHAVECFRRQGDGGVIVNTGSVAGLVGCGGAIYSATKGALHALTRAVAIEVAPLGIRVNAICPAGMPDTGFMAAGGFEASAESVAGATAYVADLNPLGRAIAADDCADAAVFLASDRSRNITGLLMPIDGGFVAQ